MVNKVLLTVTLLLVLAADNLAAYSITRDWQVALSTSSTRTIDHIQLYLAEGYDLAGNPINEFQLTPYAIRLANNTRVWTPGTTTQTGWYDAGNGYEPVPTFWGVPNSAGLTIQTTSVHPVTGQYVTYVEPMQNWVNAARNIAVIEAPSYILGSFLGIREYWIGTVAPAQAYPATTHYQFYKDGVLVDSATYTKPAGSTSWTKTVTGLTPNWNQGFISVNPLYSLSGRVTNQSGTGIANATVYLKTSPNASVNPTYTTTTDSSGNYNRNVDNGTWYVTVSATGYCPPAEQSVVVNGAAAPDVDFTLDSLPTYVVSGRVVDQGGVGIPDADVYFKTSPDASVNPTYTVSTNVSGDYSQPVNNGTWYVAAGASGYVTSDDQAAVVNGAAVPNVNFTLTALGAPVIIMGPYLQAVLQDSAYVLVESNSTEYVTVEWGETTYYGGLAYTSSTAATTADPPTYIHNIKITGLQPGNLYHYRVSQSGGAPSQDHTFKTLVQPGTNYRFAFAADSRSQPNIWGMVAARLGAADPLFVLFGGDLCATSSYDSFKNEFFIPNALSTFSCLPFYNTPGNHEVWTTNTKAFTQNPTSGSGTQDYFSFDCGDVHFVCVNNMVSYSVGSSQYNWIQQDLAASNKPWKIVWAHYPAYCKGGHGEDAGMKTMSANIFVPNGVNFVLAGHSHYYQHNLVSGIHHMVIGTAGAPLYNPVSAKYTVFQSKSYCYGVFDVTPTTLNLVVYNEAGVVLETLNLTK